MISKEPYYLTFLKQIDTKYSQRQLQLIKNKLNNNDFTHINPFTTISQQVLREQSIAKSIVLMAKQIEQLIYHQLNPKSLGQFIKVYYIHLKNILSQSTFHSTIFCLVILRYIQQGHRIFSPINTGDQQLFSQLQNLLLEILNQRKASLQRQSVNKRQQNKNQIHNIFLVLLIVASKRYMDSDQQNLNRAQFLKKSLKLSLEFIDLAQNQREQKVVAEYLSIVVIELIKEKEFNNFKKQFVIMLVKAQKQRTTNIIDQVIERLLNIRAQIMDQQIQKLLLILLRNNAKRTQTFIKVYNTTLKNINIVIIPEVINFILENKLKQAIIFDDITGMEKDYANIISSKNMKIIHEFINSSPQRSYIDLLSEIVLYRDKCFKSNNIGNQYSFVEQIWLNAVGPNQQVYHLYLDKIVYNLCGFSKINLQSNLNELRIIEDHRSACAQYYQIILSKIQKQSIFNEQIFLKIVFCQAIMGYKLKIETYSYFSKYITRQTNSAFLKFLANLLLILKTSSSLILYLHAILQLQPARQLTFILQQMNQSQFFRIQTYSIEAVALIYQLIIKVIVQLKCELSAFQQTAQKILESWSGQMTKNQCKLLTYFFIYREIRKVYPFIKENKIEKPIYRLKKLWHIILKLLNFEESRKIYYKMEQNNNLIIQSTDYQSRDQLILMQGEILKNNCCNPSWQITGVSQCKEYLISVNNFKVIIGSKPKVNKQNFIYSVQKQYQIKGNCQKINFSLQLKKLKLKNQIIFSINQFIAQPIIIDGDLQQITLFTKERITLKNIIIKENNTFDYLHQITSHIHNINEWTIKLKKLNTINMTSFMNKFDFDHAFSLISSMCSNKYISLSYAYTLSFKISIQMVKFLQKQKNKQNKPLAILSIFSFLQQFKNEEINMEELNPIIKLKQPQKYCQSLYYLITSSLLSNIFWTYFPLQSKILIKQLLKKLLKHNNFNKIQNTQLNFFEKCLELSKLDSQFIGICNQIILQHSPNNILKLKLKKLEKNPFLMHESEIYRLLLEQERSLQSGKKISYAQQKLRKVKKIQPYTCSKKAVYKVMQNTLNNMTCPITFKTIVKNYEAVKTNSQISTNMEDYPQPLTIDSLQNNKEIKEKVIGQNKKYCELITKQGSYLCEYQLKDKMLKLISRSKKPQSQHYWYLQLGAPFIINKDNLQFQINLKDAYQIFVRKFNNITSNSLQFFYSNGTSKFINFFKKKNLSSFLVELQKMIKGIKIIKDACAYFEQMKYSEKWMKGLLSNFDYLMLINKFSGRTYNDLSQYYVFPWVIQDYRTDILHLANVNNYRDLSKPIGALNQSFLQECKQKYQIQLKKDTDACYYRKHYSTEPDVYSYLFRLQPYSSLQWNFQRQEWDDPDRQFTSVQQFWENIKSGNTGNINQSIPQFYYFPLFLRNVSNIDFGKKQNNQKVNHVKLPKWCNSPQQFIVTMRAALQSDYVSKNLHHWIDLIFGVHQKSPKKYNLFRSNCYSDPKVYCSIREQKSIIGIVTQIHQFGQCPIQLFKKQHKPKNTSLMVPMIRPYKQYLQFQGKIISIDNNQDNFYLQVERNKQIKWFSIPIVQPIQQIKQVIQISSFKRKSSSTYLNITLKNQYQLTMDDQLLFDISIKFQFSRVITNQTWIACYGVKGIKILTWQQEQYWSWMQQQVNEVHLQPTRLIFSTPTGKVCFYSFFDKSLQEYRVFKDVCNMMIRVYCLPRLPSKQENCIQYRVLCVGDTKKVVIVQHIFQQLLNYTSKCNLQI